MTRVGKARSRRSPAVRTRSSRDDSVLFDSDTVAELIELFTLLLLRGGVPRAEALEVFRSYVTELPDVALPTGPAPEPDIDYFVPGEVLTKWFILPQCVTPGGQPRPLAFSGKGFTFTELVRTVDARADPKRIRDYLLSIEAIVQVGNRLVAIERKARHRLSPHMRRKTQTLAVLAQLRTVEANERNHGRAGRWFQFTTDGTVPESHLEEFKDDLDQVADQTLVAADDEMHRRTALRRRGERLVPVSLGLFMCEALPLPSLLPNTRPPVARSGAKMKKTRRPPG